MESTLKILNEMQAAGMVTRYAIGGAMAAYFYSEVVVTEDLDAFVLLAAPASELVSLTRVYDFLKARGATERREHLLLAGTLVQIIPAYDALTEEAVRDSVERLVGQTPTRVMRVEHLIAIALKTRRSKDSSRVSTLLDQADVDAASLEDILQRHDLRDNWNHFKARGH